MYLFVLPARGLHAVIATSWCITVLRNNTTDSTHVHHLLVHGVLVELHAAKAITAVHRCSIETGAGMLSKHVHCSNACLFASVS